MVDILITAVHVEETWERVNTEWHGSFEVLSGLKKIISGVADGMQIEMMPIGIEGNSHPYEAGDILPESVWKQRVNDRQLIISGSLVMVDE